MSRIQFIESALSAGGRPTLDLQGQLLYLRDEWRLMLRPRAIAADALAGVAVALVALPLSLAIAAASGVEPEVGLVTRPLSAASSWRSSAGAGSRSRGRPLP